MCIRDSGLQAGSVDIVVGTHRLLSKDVKFHDLGLLVVDEEQKFGVAVKEKLKQMKVNVDTLTMSATPMVAESPGSAPMMIPPVRPASIRMMFSGSNRWRVAGKMNSVMRNVLSKRCSAPLP